MQKVLKQFLIKFHYTFWVFDMKFDRNFQNKQMRERGVWIEMKEGWDRRREGKEGRKEERREEKEGINEWRKERKKKGGKKRKEEKNEEKKEGGEKRREEKKEERREGREKRRNWKICYMNSSMSNPSKGRKNDKWIRVKMKITTWFPL